MESVRCVVIANPTSGRGRAARRLRRFQELLMAHSEFRFSQSVGHATELAREAADEGTEKVVAAGGDGTVHEVANGVLMSGNADVCFGVLPTGSGNDYAAALKLPKDPEELCCIILNGRTRAVDAGRAVANSGQSRYFVNSIGIGLSGYVCLEARKIRWLRGLPLYGLAALRSIIKDFRAQPTVIMFDELRYKLSTLYLSVALGFREGASFVMAPEAELDDGLFDYLHAGSMSRCRALTYLPILLAGNGFAADERIRSGR